MPDCTHPACGRKGLPLAAAFPPAARLPAAHANAKNEPCPFSPNAYDFEIHAMIVGDDAWWSLPKDPDPPRELPKEFAAIVDALPAVDPAAEASVSSKLLDHLKRGPHRKLEKRAKKAPAPPAKTDVKDEDEVDAWDPSAS